MDDLYFMKKAVGILSSILACVIAVNAVVPVWSETIRQNGKDTASSDTDGYSTQDLSYTPETVPDYYDEDMTDTGILTSHKSKKMPEVISIALLPFSPTRRNFHAAKAHTANPTIINIR